MRRRRVEMRGKRSSVSGGSALDVHVFIRLLVGNVTSFFGSGGSGGGSGGSGGGGGGSGG